MSKLLDAWPSVCLMFRRAVCVLCMVVYIPLSVVLVVALNIATLLERALRPTGKYQFSDIIWGVWSYCGLLLNLMWARKVSCDGNGLSIFGLFRIIDVEWLALANVLRKHNPPFWDIILVDNQNNRILIRASEITKELKEALLDHGYDIRDVEIAAWDVGNR